MNQYIIKSKKDGTTYLYGTNKNYSVGDVIQFETGEYEIVYSKGKVC